MKAVSLLEYGGHLVFNYLPTPTKNLALWALQVGLGTICVHGGGSMLAGSERVVQTFNAVGLGQRPRYVIGLIQVVAALFLFTPRLAGVGAILLSCTMVFAIIALRSIPGQSAIHAVVLVILMIVPVGRKDRTLSLIGR